MTTAEMNKACSLRHIETLRIHGAQVPGPDGQLTELNEAFYERAVNQCKEKGFEAVCYELFLPGIDDELRISFHRDGRVNSGSAETMEMVFDY